MFIFIIMKHKQVNVRIDSDQSSKTQKKNRNDMLFTLSPKSVEKIDFFDYPINGN